MNTRVESIRAMQIYDSRGLPTVRVKIELKNAMIAAASIRSGASTGENEAVERRDGDAKAHGGKGVLKAVAHVNDISAPAVTGMEPWRQAEIDHRMIDLDGTPNKAKLGSNAIPGVSQAVAVAAAKAAGLPLYAYLGGVGAVHLPIPMIKLLKIESPGSRAVGVHPDAQWPLRRRRFIAFGARAVPVTHVRLPAGRALR